MAGGALDRRVQFRRAVLVDDGLAEVETWADHGSPVWARRQDLSDGERWRASAVAAHVTARFRLRWSGFTRDITARDRLTCEGVDYDITGVKEAEGRRQWLEITAAARADTGGA